MTYCSIPHRGETNGLRAKHEETYSDTARVQHTGFDLLVPLLSVMCLLFRPRALRA